MKSGVSRQGASMSEIVRVENLTKYFESRTGALESVFRKKKKWIRAVDGINFRIGEGSVFTLAGESGCGKTTTARMLAKLTEPSSGRIFFEGVDITNAKGERLRSLRRKIQIVFQDPQASLSPRMKVGDAIGDSLEFSGLAEDEEKRALVLKMLEEVNLVPADQFVDLYPHQLSGGQRQRVAIARAMILSPKFVVADEPVSMLDVSLSTTILHLMLDLKARFSLTYLFITHDLAVAKHISDELGVMYLGKIVEAGGKSELFSNPMHPYTRALLSAIPVPNPQRRRREIELKGEVPSALAIPTGCRFHPRCPSAFQKCREVEPQLKDVGKGHRVACHLYDELE